MLKTQVRPRLTTTSGMELIKISKILNLVNEQFLDGEALKSQQVKQENL